MGVVVVVIASMTRFIHKQGLPLKCWDVVVRRRLRVISVLKKCGFTCF